MTIWLTLIIECALFIRCVNEVKWACPLIFVPVPDLVRPSTKG